MRFLINKWCPGRGFFGYVVKFVPRLLIGA